MVNDSVGALHIALAAAVVGWLVFCISHSLAVWKKRNANGSPQSSRGLLYVGLFLCIAALAGGWVVEDLDVFSGGGVSEAFARGLPATVWGAAGICVAPALEQGA